MTRQKFTHVYDLDDDRKYLGFFLTPEGAATWMKRQASPRNLLATNEPPERVVIAESELDVVTLRNAGVDAVSQSKTLVDAGLDAAIAATKAEEASDGSDDEDPTAG